MKKEPILSPFVTTKKVEEMAELNEIKKSLPMLTSMFIDSPIKSAIETSEFKETLHYIIEESKAHKHKVGGDKDNPIMIQIIERESLQGHISEIKTALIVHTPQTDTTVMLGGTGCVLS
ncbi:MAG: hypothetical protein WC893_00845 [Candidatus Paceibacterota bacterium]|jgi:hypothetical protein